MSWRAQNEAMAASEAQEDNAEEIGRDPGLFFLFFFAKSICKRRRFVET